MIITLFYNLLCTIKYCMIKKILSVFILFSFSANAEVIVELSNKQLPYFRLPILKDYPNLYLIEDDPLLNIKYVADKDCKTFNITALTTNKSIFLDDKSVEKLITTATEYANTFCPKAKTINLNAAISPDFDVNQTLFSISLYHKNRWIEKEGTRKNNTLNAYKVKANQINTDLKDKSNIQKLAYVLGVETLDNLPSLSIDAYLTGKKTINSMILVDNINNDNIFTSYPIKAKISGLPAISGYYLIKGTLVSIPGDKTLLNNTIVVDSFIKCEKTKCSDYYDIEKIINEGRK